MSFDWIASDFHTFSGQKKLQKFSTLPGERLFEIYQSQLTIIDLI